MSEILIPHEYGAFVKQDCMHKIAHHLKLHVSQNENVSSDGDHKCLIYENCFEIWKKKLSS